jgi:hypothetical protein
VRAATVLSLIAVASTAGAVAAAQDPAAPSGNYGGGAVLAPPNSLGAPGNMLIGLRVTGNQVRLNAGLGANCESGSFRVATTLGADGVFSVSGVHRETLGGGRRLRTTYTVEGTISGATASGSARVSNRIVTKGRSPRSCTSGTVRWAARRSTGELGAPGVVAKARLYGTTSQRLAGPRRAIVMRVSSDASKLTRAIYDVTMKCDGATLTDIYDSPRRNLKIAADGSVSDVERFTRRNATTITRSTGTFAGRLGAAGAAGTFSATDRIYNRRSGRLAATCRSGTVRWTAAT